MWLWKESLVGQLGSDLAVTADGTSPHTHKLPCGSTSMSPHHTGERVSALVRPRRHTLTAPYPSPFRSAFLFISHVGGAVLAIGEGPAIAHQRRTSTRRQRRRRYRAAPASWGRLCVAAPTAKRGRVVRSSGPYDPLHRRPRLRCATDYLPYAGVPTASPLPRVFHESFAEGAGSARDGGEAPP